MGVFEQKIVEVCNAALQNATSFSSALQACRGLYPIDAFKAFQEIDERRSFELLRNEFGYGGFHLSQNFSHSSFVLSTWEFCTESRKIIAENSWGKRDNVCLLGAPSLVSLLPDADLNNCHLLIDIRELDNGSSSSNYRHLSYDLNVLRGEEFSNEFDVCFLDPPWYMSNYLHWIEVAAKYCKVGGIVSFPLLGELTRPSAEADRKAILRHCERIGLEVEIEADLALYDLPTFEERMLIDAGLPPCKWKRADIVRGRKIHAERTLIPFQMPDPLPLFSQVNLLGLTFDVVFDRFNSGTTKLIEIPNEGFWMTTPSRREAGSDKCNIFTSNGARLISERPLELVSKLCRLANKSKLQVRAELLDLGIPLELFPTLFHDEGPVTFAYR
tara:strand:+ start:982 stop:2139 length:1158 start_codon:yes stop_codon:yes gene_type:complete